MKFQQEATFKHYNYPEEKLIIGTIFPERTSGSLANQVMEFVQPS